MQTFWEQSNDCDSLVKGSIMKIFLSAFLVFLSLPSIAMERPGTKSCRSIQPNGNGQRAQSLQSIAGSASGRTESDNENFGDDVVYEGAPCPVGKICVESIFSVWGPANLLHAGVIVIDKSTGLVENLAPLRVIDPEGQSGLSINQRGISIFNQQRWERACPNIIRDVRGQYNRETPNPNSCEAEKRSGASPIVDINYYDPGPNKTGESSPFTSRAYSVFSQSGKNRAIEVLNESTATRNIWVNYGSLEQQGSAGTFGRISKLVGAVRRALDCEPLPIDTDQRVAALLGAQDEELRGCGVRLDIGAATGGRTVPFARFTLGNPEDLRVDVPREGKRYNEIRDRFAVAQSVARDCVSVQVSPDIETITCENGPLAAVNPRARSDRDRGLSRRRGQSSFVENDTPIGSPLKPQYKVTIRVVNGRIESFEGERNFTYLTDERVSCSPVPRPAGAQENGNNPGSVRRE